MEDLINEYMSLEKFAVVGATPRTQKWGYKVLMDLVEKGKTVYPIHPVTKEIEGMKCYKSIKDVPDEIDAVHFITPHEITERVAKEAVELGIKYAWMQPGAESEEAIKTLEDSGAKVLYQVCVLKQ